MTLVLESRPDTDEIDRQEKKHYSKVENLEVILCDACRLKPGSPILCTPCYHNRLVISKLRQMVEKNSNLVKENTRLMKENTRLLLETSYFSHLED